MSQRAAVVGAGVLGRLLALQLHRCGWDVTIYDRVGWDSRAACSFAAAGLLTPALEAVHNTEPRIFALGMQSTDLWHELLQVHHINTTRVRRGTLHVAHSGDTALLAELQQKLTRRFPAAEPRLLDYAHLCVVEPAFAAASFRQALYLPHDGYILNHEVLAGLRCAIEQSAITCRMPLAVTELQADRIGVGKEKSETYDRVFDCRGFNAQTDVKDLRGVRGELVEVIAPEVNLQHAVHLVHGRYPIYIVPRGDNRYAIGATQIESESLAPVSVKSAMELLSAAYSVHPGFRYANIENLVTNCRPALSDNLPRLMIDDGVWRLNGLFRYGFLMAPLLVAVTLKTLRDEPLSENELRLVTREGIKDWERDPQWN
ncbi:MAG: FAD-dependent oxidoreductase [Deltaproteobacteria bacterium]|nr:FAD-dependent oxidoreductase [Deltaproteobacteria bacterium]